MSPFPPDTPPPVDWSQAEQTPAQRCELLVRELRAARDAGWRAPGTPRRPRPAWDGGDRG